MDRRHQAVTLFPLRQIDVPEFKLRLQRAFAAAVVEQFGPQEGDVITGEEIEESLSDPRCEALKVMRGDVWVGGAVVMIDEGTQNNSLELFFIDLAEHGKGIGTAAWEAIEKRYPKTKVWRLVTPYFEKRNIHFYVNKCGFKIVEFYNSCNPDPRMSPMEPSESPFPGFEEDFLFEKVMD